MDDEQLIKLWNAATGETQTGIDPMILQFGRTVAAAHAATPQPIDEWHEDDGNVLWWIFPVCEPPYCGQPDDSDWPGYHTHWTPIVMPKEPAAPSVDDDSEDYDDTWAGDDLMGASG